MVDFLVPVGFVPAEPVGSSVCILFAILVTGLLPASLNSDDARPIIPLLPSPLWSIVRDTAPLLILPFSCLILRSSSSAEDLAGPKKDFLDDYFKLVVGI